MSQSLDLAGVQHRLPHRAPLLLVDEVQTWQADASITAKRTFKAGETVFEGHFPGFPILPGMLTIEALAQSAALLVNLSRDLTAAETRFLFMGVEQAKFRQPIHPGDEVTFEVEMLRQRGTTYKFSGTAFKNGKPAASAIFAAQLVVKEDS